MGGTAPRFTHTTHQPTGRTSMSATTPRKPADRKPPQKKTAQAKPVIAYEVLHDVLHYTTKAGHELAIDLDFPADLLKMAMGADDEDREEDEQFEIMARSFGDNFISAYGEMGVLERKRLQAVVFLEFQKAMSMPLGESLGSSDS